MIELFIDRYCDENTAGIIIKKIKLSNMKLKKFYVSVQKFFNNCSPAF